MRTTLRRSLIVGAVLTLFGCGNVSKSAGSAGQGNGGTSSGGQNSRGGQSAQAGQGGSAGAPPVCDATCHFVRAGATGDGSDWDNALAELPATLQRGHTYYVAAGTY